MGRVSALGVAAALSIGMAASMSGASYAAHGTSAGTPAAVTNAAASYTPPAIKWGPCTNPTLVSYGAQCGFVVVPLDYAKPQGRKIRLAVSRIRHSKGVKYQGPMLVNPGGPGGSGLIYSVLKSYIANGGGNGYDWIGFDPRGVGDSKPSLNCDPTYFGFNRPDYVPGYQRGSVRAWRKKAAGYAAACETKNSAMLQHEHSTEWAMDMDSIRKALGARKISYYGFSYGTYLGQLYATKFPHRVRRMVWDGVVGAKDAWYRANLNQDVAFDQNMGRYFRWIARHHRTFHLGSTSHQVKALYYKMLNKARKKPFAGVIGPDEWTDAFLQAGYYVFGWNDVASAFKDATQGRYSSIIQLYKDANGTGDPSAENTYAVYNAVQCTDAPWPPFRKQWADNKRINRKHPFETWANFWYNAPCMTWGAKAQTHAPVMRDRGVPPVLMVEERFDAATPWAGAIQTRRTFGNSRLIVGVRGTTHAGSLEASDCTLSAVAAYLKSGKLPPRLSGARADKRCGPVAKPAAHYSPGARTASSRVPAWLLKDLVRAQQP